MTKYTLLKIKSGKRKIWEEWCAKLEGEHKEEAIQTINEEDLIRERCVIFGVGDSSFVFYEHEAVPGKLKKPFNSKRELNQEHHRKFHECLEKIEGYDGVVGYDVKSKNYPT